MIDVKELKAGFSKGLGIAIGFFVIFGLGLSVYAFVEPSSGPSADFYFDSNSPIITNNTIRLVGYSDTFTPGDLDGLDGAIDECDSLYPGSRPASFTDIRRLGPAYNFTYDVRMFPEEIDPNDNDKYCRGYRSSSSGYYSGLLQTNGYTNQGACNFGIYRFACVIGH